MVSTTQRDEAVASALARERELTGQAAQRAEAAWGQRAHLMEQQLTHQAGQVAALRRANEELELQLGAVQEELRGATAGSSAELVRLQQALEQAQQRCVRLEGELAAARQHAEEQAQRHTEQLAHGQVAAAGQASDTAAAAHELERTKEQLTEAHAALQRSTSDLRALQQEQLLRAGSMRETGVQVQLPAASWDHAVALVEPLAAVSSLPVARLESAPSASSGGRSRLGTAVPPSPASLPPLSPEPMSASQLQLELARVRVTPMRPLPAFAAAAWRGQQAAELASSRRVTEQQQLWSGPGSAASGGRSPLGRAPSPGSSPAASTYAASLFSLEEEDEEEEAFNTPMAGSPTSVSCAAPPLPVGDVAAAPPPPPPQFSSSCRARIPVPPLRLDALCPTSAPSLDGTQPPSQPASHSTLPPGARSSSSLDSPGSSLLLLGGSTPASAGTPASALGPSPRAAAPAGGSWSMHPLDASLERLARLTAGLRQW